MNRTDTELQSSYDRVAQSYTEEYSDELTRKPFDRELLDGFATSLRGEGEVCEIGCGPGQIARYLKDRGVNMLGLDLSAEMVKCARRLNPDIPFVHGDMLTLDLPQDSLGGIVAFYAMIHLKREQMTPSLKEMRRALKPGGRLLVSFHGGEGELHRDEWYGQPVSIDVTLMTNEEMSAYLHAAGFAEVIIRERKPYEFEYPTPRLYAFARKGMDS